MKVWVTTRHEGRRQAAAQELWGVFELLSDDEAEALAERLTRRYQGAATARLVKGRGGRRLEIVWRDAH
jgi:hypothetical protein